jgi:adenine-specific DNA-methyltransferase
MAAINFKGKNSVWNHHLAVPYQILEKDKKLSRKGSNEKDNLIIEADNLLALKSLLPKYQGRIKCIYIDPPYNIGNGGWVYNDKVNSPLIKNWLGLTVNKEDLTKHDKWLCMMTPRLKLLQELLTNDGLIFVSIDDNELHRLKQLMDEIFNEDNFISTLCVVTNPGGRDYGGIALTHEYVLVYKNSKESNPNEISKGDNYNFPYNDSLGGFEVRELRNRNIRFNISNRPNLFYPFFINPKVKDDNGFYSVSLKKSETHFKEILPKKSQDIQTVWRWGKEKANKHLNVNLVGRMKKDGGFQIVEKYRKETKMIKSFLNDSEYVTERGTEVLKEIFNGESIFDYPKSVALIKVLLEIGSDKDSIILDSFAGSGTTAQAVLELNKKDKGNRKFILVQLPEKIEKDKPAYKVGFRNVHEITRERVKRVIERYKLGVGFSYLKLGPQIDADSILSGNLPTYKEFAKYTYYLATGKTMDDEKAINEKDFFVGKTNGESVYLIYERDKEKLKNLAITLDWANKINDKDKSKKIVYAPACFLDEEYLEKFNISFVSIPYNLFEKK